MKKQLTRSRDQKWVAGICGGIARYTGVDVNLIRLLTVVLTLIGVGTVVVVYVVAWFLMPLDDTFNGPPASPAPPAPPSA